MLYYHNMINYGFEPVYDKDSLVLILGSFPSVKSRATGFYYGNKQNRFWKTLGQIFDENIDDDKISKISFLLKHHIALYDVVKISDVKGSMDNELVKSKNKIADLSFLLPPNTNVTKIICNGKASFNLVKDNLKTDLPIIYLSSTSPANPRYNFEEWNYELNFLK